MEEKWYTDDKIFFFDFTINYSGEVKPQVSVIIYRDKYYAQNVKKEIQFNCTTEFALLFEDHIDIQGTLTYQGNPEKNNYILWGNFHYGENYGKHFDGTMILFPVATPYPPSPPLPPPPSPPVLMDCKIVDMRIGENRKDDLFPYIYMRKWPVVSKEDLFFNFIFYEKKIFSPPGELLIDNLIALAYQREQMILLAIDYINMNWPPPITFVAKIENLPGPIISFPEVYHKIRQRPFTDYEELISIIENTLGKSLPELLAYMESAEYLQAKERVWQSYFALIFVQGYQEELLEGFLGILITDHLIEIINGETVKTLTPGQIKKLIDAVIVVPFNLFPIPGSNVSPPLSPPISSPHTGIIPYAIGELQMVRQQFLKYEAGEIAHIENILKGEKKEIKRRNLDRMGETFSEEIASAESIDNSSLGKTINFLNEALKTIENNTVTTDYSNLKTSYGPPNVIIYDGSWTVTEPGKKKEEMTMFARDIINKTVNRINRRVKEARYHFALNESEETTTSVFDNSRSAENLSGIYRWLNKVYLNFVVNYGRRLMMEFVVKEPASVYIQKEFDLEGISLSRPKSPSEKNITSYNEITSKDYGEYATQYTGVEPPPEDRCTVSAVLINEEEKLVTIPGGYLAKEAYVTTNNLPAGDELQILIGKNHYTSKDLDSGIPIMMNDEDKIVPIAIIGNPVPVSPPAAPNNFVVTVEISCEP
ncbi:MAG: hypothetical protein MUF15_22810, partial [Acidobacteria bacterium]|nr:hypothetical protein [Acidobacteriota bacterium]